jgi:hypothetical protein
MPTSSLDGIRIPKDRGKRRAAAAPKLFSVGFEVVGEIGAGAPSSVVTRESGTIRGAY